MDDRNDMWRRESDSYREGGKLNPEGRGRTSNGSRFWQALAVACLVLLVVFAGIIAYLLVGRSSNATSNGTNPNKLQTIVGSTPTAIQAQPSATPTPVPPTPTSPPTIGTILCQADAAHGWNGWGGSSDWKTAGGMLLNDGTSNTYTPGSPTIIAPCQLDGITDYAVEVTGQMINIPCCQDDSFGITVRGNSAPNGWQGYVAGVENGSTPSAVIWADSLPLASGNFNPEHNWYTYRVEVKGNAIKFLIDGAPVLEATDNKYLTGTQIGLLCTLAMQINISSFKVIVL